MEAFVGTILTFGFNFAPSQWALCNGQTIAISQNAALFSLLGTTYGGNGVSTFQLPNLQSRIPIGMGTGLGLSTYVIGQASGTENVMLTINNLPSHTHTATFTPSGGGPVSVTINASTNTSGNSNIPTTANNVIGGAPASGPGAAHVWAAANSGTVPIGGVTASGGGGSGTVTNALTGNGLPVSIMNPYLALNFSISMFGIFPSRN